MNYPPTDTIVVVVDGGQTAPLIFRCQREQGVHAELAPWDAPADRVTASSSYAPSPVPTT